MSREECLLPEYERCITKHLCNAKGELDDDDYEQLLIRVVQAHPELKRAAQAAAFVELPA